MAEAKRKLMFVIEHLEPEVSEWLQLEYAHASEIVGKGNLIFTNVKRAEDFVKLLKLGNVERRSFRQIFRPGHVVILDPQAEAFLKREDFIGKMAVVIGGILGDHPPRGRTYKLITSKFPGAVARSLGRGQFTIDGSAYVAKLVSEGQKLEDIPVRRGLTLKLSEHHLVRLPYVYPLKDGKPVISKALIEYLRSDGYLKAGQGVKR